MCFGQRVLVSHPVAPWNRPSACHLLHTSLQGCRNRVYCKLWDHLRGPHHSRCNYRNSIPRCILYRRSCSLVRRMFRCRARLCLFGFGLVAGRRGCVHSHHLPSSLRETSRWAYQRECLWWSWRFEYLSMCSLKMYLACKKVSTMKFKELDKGCRVFKRIFATKIDLLRGSGTGSGNRARNFRA
jgi:hypothetical protein